AAPITAATRPTSPAGAPAPRPSWSASTTRASVRRQGNEPAADAVTGTRHHLTAVVAQGPRGQRRSRSFRTHARRLGGGGRRFAQTSGAAVLAPRRDPGNLLAHGGRERL